MITFGFLFLAAAVFFMIKALAIQAYIIETPQIVYCMMFKQARNKYALLTITLVLVGCGLLVEGGLTI